MVSSSQEEFWCLERPVGGNAHTEYLTWGEPNVGEAQTCDECGNYVELLPWLSPWTVELEVWGDEYGEIVLGVGEILVTADLRERITAADLKGIEFLGQADVKRAITHGRKWISHPPQYYVARIKRSTTRVDFAASGVRWRNPGTSFCNRCGSCKTPLSWMAGWDRIVIDEQTWKGEDFFVPENLRVKILTQRAVDVIGTRPPVRQLLVRSSACRERYGQ